jgi:hypothetical protein
MKIILSSVFFLLTIINAVAQEDLMNQLEAEKPKEHTVEFASFKALQICNMQSTKLPAKGEWYMLISHRFGDITKGVDNFFGLDNALTKIGGIYGVSNRLSLGFSRQTFNKTYEIAIKYKIANQIEGVFPLTIAGYNTIDINSALKADAITGIKIHHRLAYSTQLLISRKISDKFSIELAPIYIHKNLYDGILDQKDLVLVGLGTRYKLTKRLSANLEYAARLNLPEGFTSTYYNPLSIGLDIDTGGHVFQLVLSNSQPMSDVVAFSNAGGNWYGGSLYFGFNMYRVF